MGQHKNPSEPDESDWLHRYDASWRNVKSGALFVAVLAALVFIITLLL
jgi:hypothetical protein